MWLKKETCVFIEIDFASTCVFKNKKYYLAKKKISFTINVTEYHRRNYLQDLILVIVLVRGINNERSENRETQVTRSI